MIFISHRAADKHIADALRANIVTWGVDPRQIGQSPVTASNQRVDKGINQARLRELFETKLFVLVYTSPDDDWSMVYVGGGRGVRSGRHWPPHCRSSVHR